MPRFVLLEHDHPHLHWDLMLEHGPVLKTWRLARMPCAPGDPIPAEPLGDHRLLYLDYEGPLSGDRGQVIRQESGTYEVSEGSFDEGRVVLRLTGTWLQGTAVLQESTFMLGERGASAP